MVAIKQGPLTREELMSLWRSVTDEEYSRPLVDGDPHETNVAAVEQAAEQLAAVSQQIDRNTQAMFILPWSGQTNESARGGEYARVVLRVTRTREFAIPLLFTTDVVVQHRLDDYGPNGAVDVTTNRQYRVEAPAALGVGEAGPIDLAVVAVNQGYGYNASTPGTLQTLLQPGVGFENLGATVMNNPGRTHRVVCSVLPDVPITEHVGQYLLFTAGANTGQHRRIVGVENPDSGVPHGGVFNVAAELILSVTAVVGVFTLGERVQQPASGAVGEFVSLYGGKLVLCRTEGVFTGGDPLVAEFGATATVTAKEQSELLVEETGTAAWRVVHWREDLSVEVTNVEQPTGGRSGFLDELGNERRLPRLTNESDEEYRRRVSVPADVVTPAAVLRAANKILEPYNVEACLREVGRANFRGVFHDGGFSSFPFAHDLALVEMTLSAGGFVAGERVSSVNALGVITTGKAVMDYVVGTANQVFRGVVEPRGPGFLVGNELVGHVSGAVATILTTNDAFLPEYRFIVALDLREFRGFFLVGVPPLVFDDFGFYHDVGSNGAHDTNTITNFHDGQATNTKLYTRVRDAVNAVRPAGVRFEVYLETIGCV